MDAELKFKFNLPEERSSLLRTIKATDCYIAFFEIANEVFRPSRKHGYSDIELQKINEYLEGDHAEVVGDVIGLLEKKFFNILEHYGINLDDLE